MHFQTNCFINACYQLLALKFNSKHWITIHLIYRKHLKLFIFTWNFINFQTFSSCTFISNFKFILLSLSFNVQEVAWSQSRNTIVKVFYDLGTYLSWLLLKIYFLFVKKTHTEKHKFHKKSNNIKIVDIITKTYNS